MEDVRVLTEKLAKLTKTSANSSKPPCSDIVNPKREVKGKKVR